MSRSLDTSPKGGTERRWVGSELVKKVLNKKAGAMSTPAFSYCSCFYSCFSNSSSIISFTNSVIGISRFFAS